MLKVKYVLALVVAMFLAVSTCFAASDELLVAHVKVTMRDASAQGKPPCVVDQGHSRALAETLGAARDVYVQLGFDMPEIVNLSITCGGDSTNLFTDGYDQLFLSIKSLNDLAPPAKSGVFNIYGMCHELGHVAMYRILKNRDWMTDAAAEGWAHYIGSQVVDSVFAAKGTSLWPDQYDYLQDGTARLQKDTSSKSPSDVAVAAAQWQALGSIIGPRNFASLFAAWQSASITSTRPWETLLPAIQKLQPRSETSLNDWWKGAGPILVRKVSEVSADQVSTKVLSGQTVELPAKPAAETNHASIGGGGEGRKFTLTDAGDLFITAVSVYGSRYGEEAVPPDMTFDIVLSDGDARMIAIWKGQYASFKNGNDGWARFEVPPTRVPHVFNITLDFHATASNGVYVAFDSASNGSSVDTLPWQTPHPFLAGDWMIRVELDHKK
jgi:hypothetical protein